MARAISKPIIALINPNTTAATTTRMVRIAAEVAGPTVDIAGITAPFGEPLITDPQALAIARDAVLSLDDATFVGISGVIVAAFGDPGAVELGRRLAVPVVGLAEASMQAAAAIGRFSVVTTTPLLAASIRQRAAMIGLGDRLASVRTSDADPVRLTSDERALRASLAALIERAVGEDGAEAVIVGGGPLADAARHLATASPVPLIEPVPAATLRLIACLGQRDRD